MAVALGSPLFATLTTIPVGADTVTSELKRVKSETGMDASATALEDVLQHCFVRSMSDSIGESTEEHNQHTWSSAVESLFLDPPSSCLAEHGLAGAVLTCLDKVPVLLFIHTSPLFARMHLLEIEATSDVRLH